MTNASIKSELEGIDQTISRIRDQITDLCEELENLSDYLDLIEARSLDEGKPTFGHEKMKERLGVK